MLDAHSEDYSEGSTAFRAAEKSYKLAQPQHGRRRRRAQGGATGATPANFPDILDFRDPDSINQRLVYALPSGCHCQPLQRIYSLPTHPGLYLLPGAVPPEAQRSFLKDVTGRLLEPPATTNHSATHGPLPGLWRAAAQGLRLRRPPASQPPPSAPPAKRKAASEATPGVPAGPPATSSCHGLRGEVHPQTAEQPGAPSAAAVPASGGTDRNVTFEAAWSADGGGLPAAALVQRLRWLTVGPAYDWTARRYDFQGPYRPLPGYAADLGRRLVAAVGAAVLQDSRHTRRQQPGGGNASAGAPEPVGQHAQRGCVSTHARADAQQGAAVQPAGHDGCQHRGPAPGFGQPRAMDVYADGEAQPQLPAPGMHHSPPSQPARPWQRLPPHAPSQQQVPQRQHSSQPAWSAEEQPSAAAYEQEQAQRPHEAPPQPFVPDAALVCFYRAGHTLCGHKDDVEHDVSQPIVSLSLGCSAVLLVGGCSRNDAPVAVLVRHGDAVVFTGPARMYYHGVPRVFDDGCEALAQDGLSKSLRPDLLDIVRHTRINISIRAVL